LLLSKYHKIPTKATLPKRHLTTGTEVSGTLSTSSGERHLESAFPSGDAWLQASKLVSLWLSQGNIISAKVTLAWGLCSHPCRDVGCAQANVSQNALSGHDSHSNLWRVARSSLCCRAFQRQYLSFRSEMKMKASVWQNIQYDAKHFMS